MKSEGHDSGMGFSVKKHLPALTDSVIHKKLHVNKIILPQSEDFQPWCLW